MRRYAYSKLPIRQKALPTMYVALRAIQFTMALRTIKDMWGRVMLFTLAVNAILFLMCGLAATAIHLTGPRSTRSRRWIIAAFAAPMLGVLNAFVLGAVPAFLIGAVYVNVPATMSETAALGWGCGQGLFIALVNAGAFQRIV